MSTRHPVNTNLTLMQAPTWNGYPIQHQQGVLITEYLEKIKNVCCNALREHPRTCVFRVDLKFPAQGYQPDSEAITRFISSLKSQIIEDTKSKVGHREYVHPCTLRYVWVREQHSSENWHYHVAIFLNKDRFNALGRFKSPEEYQTGAYGGDSTINMADRLRKAWASALKVDLSRTIGLVHFHPPFLIDANAADFNQRFNDLFHWLSYLAKVHTKQYGNRHRNFGCSQN